MPRPSPTPKGHPSLHRAPLRPAPGCPSDRSGTPLRFRDGTSPPKAGTPINGRAGDSAGCRGWRESVRQRPGLRGAARRRGRGPYLRRKRRGQRAERSKSDVQGRGGGAAGASPVPGGDCRPHPLQEWGKAKGAGAGGLQGPRPSSANQQRPAASWRASGVGGEADGRVSVAPQPRRRQGGLGGVPLLPAPEDTALPHPPVGQCRPGHPLSPSAAGGATLPVDPPPLCSTVTPQATPSSWLQQSLSAQSSPHAGPHPEPSPVSLAPLDTPVPQNKSSSLGLTRPCPQIGRAHV